jgi:hypothetical protein
VGVAVHAVPDGDAGGAGCRGEGLGPDAGLGRDVFEAALPRLVLLAQPVRVDVAAGLRGGLLETGAGEELPDGAFAVPVIRAILRGPNPCSVNARSLSVSGGSGSGAAVLAGSLGAGWRAAVSRACSAVVPSRAAMTWTGRPERMSGCRLPGLMSPGCGPGQVMPGTQSKGRFPGDGFVDAGVAEQEAGSLVEEAGHRLGQGEDEFGVVLAAAFGQPQRFG